MERSTAILLVLFAYLVAMLAIGAVFLAIAVHRLRTTLAQAGS